MRAYMNTRLASVRFVGRILDVGGGRDTRYLSFHPDVIRVETLDAKAGHSINFEADPLPMDDGSYDTVLLFNVLEHVFNFAHLLSEARRVLARGGTMHGVVPFMVRYHPDPHDYFRYTEETLRRILGDAGFSDVQVESFGGGPFVAAAHQFLQYFPRILRVPVFMCFFIIDGVFVRLRPHSRSFYPLGYYFSAHNA